MEMKDAHYTPIDDIAVLIVTRCTQDRVFNCIRSIIKTTSPGVLNHLKLYIMYTGDNYDHVHKLETLLESVNVMHCIQRDHYNFAKNVNKLAKLGTEPFMLCINDDIELITDSITHCVDILNSNENFGTVGIKLLFENGNIQHAGHLLLMKNDDFFQITHYLLKQPNQQLPDYVSVGNTFAFCMFRRVDFEVCGALNESYNKCFEDVEFNWKLLMKGKVHITAGSITAYHYESTSRKLCGQLIEKADADKLISFFEMNKNEILQNESLLERTIKRI